jgi:hypothetical protein
LQPIAILTVEGMGRTTIERKHLRASAKQVEWLIQFEERTDDEVAEGKAGSGEEAGTPFTKRWDKQIQRSV